MVSKQLEGQVALITGGGTGMGQAIAQLFAREGARVVVVGRRPDPLIETVNDIRAGLGQADHFVADVSNWRNAESMVDFTLSTFGGLDILVTCAGVIRRTEKIEETTEEQWNQQIDINLKGTFAALHFALPRMMEQKRGVIVAISSTSAFAAAPGYGTYCASKGGVSALIRCVAVQYADFGIRANAICPGMVHTPMSYVDRPKPFDEIYEGVLQQSYPIKRLAVPGDVANMALFLAADTSSYVTGQNLFVDGGFTAR